MFLGLDISSNNTGIAVLDSDEILVLNTNIDTKNIEDLFEVIKFQTEQIDLIFNKYKIEHVYIEEPLQKFQTGSSSAHTISVLLKTNYVLSWLIYDKYNIKPVFISRTTARKDVCGKKNKSETDKDICLQWCIDNEPLFELTKGPRGGMDKGNYDRADSIIIVRAGCKKLKK